MRRLPAGPPVVNTSINTWRKFASPLPIYVPDFLIAAILSLAALIIRLGFLAEYPNTLLHEDSGPYLTEAERLLEGRETDGGVPARPPGYPLFLAAVIKLLTTDLLHIILLQHVLAVAGALLLTFALRMMNVRRLFAYSFFVAVAFSHRLIHYDNTIGAETWSMFLMSAAFFLACGMLLRRWNPWLIGSTLGVLFAYLFLVRTASFFLAALIAIWVVIPPAHRLNLNLVRRLALIVLIVFPLLLAGSAMLQWNKHYYGQAVLSREVTPVMTFAIAYSADMTKGIYPDLKRDLLPVVQAGRAKLGPQGYPGGTSDNDGYQWAFKILTPLDISRFGSQQERYRVVSDLFWETLLTPETLYNHLTGHVWRELRFMLFDMTPVTNSVTPPREYANFMRRDTRSLRIVQARDDHTPGTLLERILPGPVGTVLQRFTSRYIHVNYHTEYKQKPGAIRFYAAISVVLLGVFAVAVLVGGWRRRIVNGKWRIALSPEDFSALFASLIWLSSALVLCTLLYALHRYSYYVLPFVAFTAFYGIDRGAGIIARWLQRTSPVTWS